LSIRIAFYLKSYRPPKHLLAPLPHRVELLSGSAQRQASRDRLDIVLDHDARAVRSDLASDVDLGGDEH
jgi:hypothetical protein